MNDLTDMPELPDIASYAAPIYVGLIVAEILFVHFSRAKGSYETRDASTSIAMGLGNVTSGIIFATTVYAGIFAFFLWIYRFAPVKWEFGILSLLACFVLDDLRYYWVHRFSHTIRWGWADHVIHHSSQHFNLSTALRQPWFSFAKGYFVSVIPLVLLGFHPAMIAFAGSINLFYQFFIHTEAVGKMPKWVEAVMNTPSHHRVHHGRNARYLDSNYAGVFIVWDRLFGTFVEEDDSHPVRYGLVKNIGTYNPLRVATHEYVGMWRDATLPGLSVKQRLAYVFAPPGWSHDGSRKSSADIKLDFISRHPDEAGKPGLPGTISVKPAPMSDLTDLPSEPAAR
uniref:Fatty acid hydroxylase n=2 Tax=Aquisalinus luteolus TaxID=1566827 RepID=A0A8J3EPL8_9PROT|nr:sterol desaturase family protein [Aquisalinus luteolus]GGH98646.1 fatty acid hydroxylase [Aquisalinus luteolus]